MGNIRIHLNNSLQVKVAISTFKPTLVGLLFLVTASIHFACSNSEYIGSVEENDITICSNTKETIPSSHPQNTDFLHLNDTAYHYTGIPRIIIETENHHVIKDRETEIPAKMQIWEGDVPESEVMTLTIKGRGNSTWGYPKKPYIIKFDNKQSILGMPKAKKWVMLANYRDRTLIRNALAFEISRQSNLKWTPQGKFADLYLNDIFLGNYYICEKIENKKNRLNLGENGILIEFDEHVTETITFRTSLKKLPAIIHSPQNMTSSQTTELKNFIDSLEMSIYNKESGLNIEDYLDLKSLALYWIVYEIAGNAEMTDPHSLFAYKNTNTPLHIGPVWDFDWGTFAESYTKGLMNKNNFWIDSLKTFPPFQKIVQGEWLRNREKYKRLTNFIDSLAEYLLVSNQLDSALWPIHITKGLIGDEQDSYETAINKLKKVHTNRLKELDSLFFKL